MKDIVLYAILKTFKETKGQEYTSYRSMGLITEVSNHKGLVPSGVLSLKTAS